MQQLRPGRWAASLMLVAACSDPESDRLDLVVSGTQGASLLVRVRDDGPPRAVGAGVYLPPPEDLGADSQTITVKPATDFIGKVTVYVVACQVRAECRQDSAIAPDCRCASPLAFGAAQGEVVGQTRLTVTLAPWQSACDADADEIVDCARSPACCASMNPDTRAAVSDCNDGPATADCVGQRCDPARSHPFMATEPAAAQVDSVPGLARRNASFCEDTLNNDCAGDADSLCALLDADQDGYSPRGDPADCDDDNFNVHPGGEDNCQNAIDDNCDGVADICDADHDGTADAQDCAPDDATRFLGAPDPCGDGIDQDCDGGDPLCIPEDLDGDGYPCTDAEPGGAHRCVGAGQDCDDLNTAAHPGATERCDRAGAERPSDENCDGIVEVCPDADGDGDGARDRDAGGADCDDLDPLRYPGAPERCGDGIDQDCNGADQPCGMTQDADADGWAAGADCNDRDASIAPGAEEYCNARDDDCDGAADEGNPLALGAGLEPSPARCGDECPGFMPCRCYTAPTACSPDPVAVDQKVILCIGVSRDRYLEVCNGFDDDCDGGLNNEKGAEELLSRACYTGPAGTEGKGTCVGSKAYCRGSAGGTEPTEENWGPCDGEVVPRLEVCNGLDEDCDEVLNNGPDGAPLRMSCYPCPGGTAGLGPCREGETTCVDNEWVACMGHACPEIEECNGRDDNCDGEVDTIAGEALTEECYFGPPETRDQGECRHGTATCAGGRFVGCAGERQPDVETCDDDDEDCDGRTDEDLVMTCGEDTGVCALGTSVCHRGDWGECMDDVRPAQESCNNLDDDCDGMVDNGVRRPCGIETGECRMGLETCVAGAFDGVCQGAIIAVAETCNDDDDDCDSMTDEGLDMNCRTGAAAPCDTGIQRCRGGSFGQCEVQPLQAMELCDGLDNNCNGRVDERFDLGMPCSVGIGACLEAGVLVCAEDGASSVCDAEEGTGSAETCNGQDDDCDMRVDEEVTCGPTGDTCGGMAGCRCGDLAPCAAGVICTNRLCPAPPPN